MNRKTSGMHLSGPVKEAPEMFRVIGKRKPEYVKPYLEKLEWIAENDENPIVRIHSAGAIRITKKALKES